MRTIITVPAGGSVIVDQSLECGPVVTVHDREGAILGEVEIDPPAPPHGDALDAVMTELDEADTAPYRPVGAARDDDGLSIPEEAAATDAIRAQVGSAATREAGTITPGPGERP